MSKNPKDRWKLKKIANIDREIVHSFWTNWGNSINFSGKMCLKIILKVTRNQDFNLSLEDTFLEKPWWGVGGQIDPLIPPSLIPPSCPPPAPSPNRFRIKIVFLFQFIGKNFEGKLDVSRLGLYWAFWT